MGNVRLIEQNMGGKRSKEFYFETTADHISGFDTVRKFGGRILTSTDEEDIWLGEAGTTGDKTHTYLQAASALRIKAGGSADDDTAGTGAREIQLFGTDASFNERYSTLATAGASASLDTVEEYTRIYRVKLTKVGTYYTGTPNTGANADDIIIETIGGVLQSVVPQYTGQTVGSHFTTAANTRAFVKRIKITMDSNKITDVFMKIRQDADITVAPFAPVKKISYWYGLTDPLEDHLDIPMPIPGKTDIWFTAQGASGTKIEVEYDLVIEDI